MKHRDDYKSIDDFLSDESFLNWVKYNESTSDWEDWIQKKATLNQKNILVDARIWIYASKVEKLNFTDEQVSAALEETLDKIKKTQPQSFQIFRITPFFFKAAASILLIGLASLSLVNFVEFKKDLNTVLYAPSLGISRDLGMIEVRNDSNKPKLINLSDGSSILLYPGSKLKYPQFFVGKSRIVTITGEGFFEISKDPAKPFYVYSNDVITKVYGTSFRIIAYDNQPSVQVLVHTGRVKVSSNTKKLNNPKEEVLLVSNQAIRFKRKELKFEIFSTSAQGKFQNQDRLLIEQFDFEYKDIPVNQIFRDLEQAYQVKIDFPEEKLKNCYLTTSLSDVPLMEKLKIVCESLGNDTKFEIKDDHIPIYANQCN